MPLNILLLEPFMGESHRDWALGLQRHSRHRVTIWDMPGRHWKWRMHGAAETFAARFLDELPQVDLILATDMLDLAGFLAHTRRATAHIPTAIYFHENQLAYPWSPDDPDPALQRDHHYGYINYRSALVADSVMWNSTYNMESFLAAMERLMHAFPDARHLENLQRIRDKSVVLPLGLELPSVAPAQAALPPLIVWNHRWEYDKGPELFFETLMALAEEGLDFRLAVLGRSYVKEPSIFVQAQQALRDRIVHWGFVEDRATYWRWLSQAHIAPVTARQDFFGASVAEAMHMGCMPLLPNALAYPSHIPDEWRAVCLYAHAAELRGRLRTWLRAGVPTGANPQSWVRGYAWQALAPAYDQHFTLLAAPID